MATDTPDNEWRVQLMQRRAAEPDDMARLQAERVVADLTPAEQYEFMLYMMNDIRRSVQFVWTSLVLDA